MFIIYHLLFIIKFKELALDIPSKELERISLNEIARSKSEEKE
jgi:hypothetical protein